MNKFVLFIFISTTSIFSSLFSDQLMIDPFFSPNSSSNSYLYLENRLMQLQSAYIKSKKVQPIHNKDPQDLASKKIANLSKSKNHAFLDSIYGKVVMGTLRSFELGLVWYPLHQVAATVQHEVFGHGYRIRTMNPAIARVVGYKMRFNFTNGNFGPTEAYTLYTCDPKRITPSQELAVTSAGVEAESIFAHNVLMSWLERGRIDPRQASLWQINSESLFSYIYTLNKVNGIDIYDMGKKSSHDIAHYIYLLNVVYPSSWSIDAQYSHMLSQSALSISCNPFTYISVYAQLWYILFNEHVKVPGLDLGVAKGLPGFSYALTPFGPENIYQFYYWGKDISPGYLYFKQGKYEKNSYLGFGYESTSLLKTKVGSFGIKADFWVQPQMIKKPLSPQTEIKISQNPYYASFYVEPMNTGLPSAYSRRFGGAASLIYKYVSKEAAFQNFINHTWLQLGYKTEGFMPGEPLSASLIIKLGLGYLF